MNLLVDSHALLWWFAASPRLSPPAADALKASGNRVYVSAAVVWELSIKVNLGKVDADALLSDLQHVLFARGFRKLAISMDHALRAGHLPLYHKDPFDRMLIAQAQTHNFAIVSADSMFDRYAVSRVW